MQANADHRITIASNTRHDLGRLMLGSLTDKGATGLIFVNLLNFASDMLAHMIFFDASSYSKRTYARFRSSQALERFISSPHATGRAVSLKWAQAWLLVVQKSVMKDH